MTRVLWGGVRAAALCTLVAAHAGGQPAGDDRLRLYQLALAEPELTGRRSPSDVLVVQGEVIDPTGLWDFPSDEIRPDSLDPAKRLAYAERETINRFLAPGEVLKVPAALGDEPAVAVVSWDELSDLWADRVEGGTEFDSRFGQGARIIQFSAVGVNGAETEALLYVTEICGPGCGTGRFVLFKRAGGEWRIERIDRFAEY